jgi:hypothetical protein
MYDDIEDILNNTQGAGFGQYPEFDISGEQFGPNNANGYTRHTVEGNLLNGFVMRTEEVGKSYHTMLKNNEIEKMQAAHAMGMERATYEHQLRMQEIAALGEIQARNMRFQHQISLNQQQLPAELLTASVLAVTRLLTDRKASELKLIPNESGSFEYSIGEAKYLPDNSQTGHTGVKEGTVAPACNDSASKDIYNQVRGELNMTDFSNMRFGSSAQTQVHPAGVEVVPDTSAATVHPAQRQGVESSGTGRGNAEIPRGGGYRQTPSVEQSAQHPVQEAGIEEQIYARQPGVQPAITGSVDNEETPAPSSKKIPESQPAGLAVPVPTEIMTEKAKEEDTNRVSKDTVQTVVERAQGTRVPPDSKIPVPPESKSVPKPVPQMTEEERKAALETELRLHRERVAEIEKALGMARSTNRYTVSDAGCPDDADFPQILYVPEDGYKTLPPETVEECVPLVSGAWVEVEYGSAYKTSMEFYERTSESPNSDKLVDFSHVEKLDIYKHHVLEEAYQQYAGPNPEDLYWEAFDIPVRAIHWKRYIAKYLGGITAANAAIIRLLNNTNPERPAAYLSVYMNNEDLSGLLRGIEESRAKQGGEQRGVFMAYNDIMNENPETRHFMSLLRYAYYLNKGKTFPIIEQIANYRQPENNNRLMLSPTFPKTEFREEYNIFANRPEFVVTNYHQRVLLCSRSENPGQFVIRRMVVK